MFNMTLAQPRILAFNVRRKMFERPHRQLPAAKLCRFLDCDDDATEVAPVPLCALHRDLIRNEAVSPPVQEMCEQGQLF